MEIEKKDLMRIGFNFIKLGEFDEKHAGSVNEAMNDATLLKVYNSGLKILTFPEIIDTNNFITTYKQQYYVSIADIIIKDFKLK